MAPVWHVLFLACLPVAIVLLVTSEPLAAAAVFLIGAPVFWTLRNRAAMKAPKSSVAVAADMTHRRVDEALRGEPDRYPINAEMTARLSSRNFDDVPVVVRVGSPYDATDADVRRTLSRLGVLHPGTNFAVVYRTCFAPLIDDGESAKFLRFGWASLDVGPPERPRRFDEPEQAWIFVSDRGVYWHQLSDRVIGMPARNPVEDLMLPRREFFFVSNLTVVSGDVMSGPGGMALVPLMLESVEGDTAWRAALFLAPDPQTDELLAYVRGRAGVRDGGSPSGRLWVPGDGA